MADDPIPELLARATEALQAEFESLPAYRPARGSDSNTEALAQVLGETARRLGDNYPYFHPLYAGQMLKPPHPVARAAYALAMTINPNNHARDGGRASSEMEIEAVAEIAGMFGWKEYLGHLTSSGTFANMEVLWVANNIHPKKKIVASELAHYTHERISGVLGIRFQKIRCNKSGEMDVKKLEAQLKKGTIGTVVVTMGTTGIGSVDPLDEILELQRKFSFRIHLDAAYGGYFKLADNLSETTMKRFSLTQLADSMWQEKNLA